MHFKSNEIVPKCGRLWAFKDGLPIWPPFSSQMKNRKGSPFTFLDDFWILIMIASLYFHISDNPLKTMYQGGKKGEEKKPARQLLRVKNPLDLLIFLLWVSLISYPNDTKGLLQVSCAHYSALKWNLTIFQKVR